MTNGISALAARRREQPAIGKTWHTPTVLSPGLSPRASANTSPDYAVVPVNAARSPASAVVVGGGVKRGFDIVAALVAIILLLPLAGLIALAIKLWDRGPIFYRHRRIGLNGVPFDCLKFRSMVVNADEVLARHLASNSEAAREWEESRKLKRDPRITPLGESMRRTSLDELPQLLNILKGEMSFVGPRPIVTAEVPKYGDCIAQYLCARPGLTGPWQVSGRNDVAYATRVALDRDYVNGWSFKRDLAILARTVRVVLSARGCY